jgi:hypothetical protein
MAGVIVIILVMGYMAAVSVSQSYLVQAEVQGASARKSGKQAYYAAFAGINYVLSKLRQDPTNTYGALNLAKYFCNDGNGAATQHHRAFATVGNTTYNARCGAACSQLASEKAYSVVGTFAQNEDTIPSQSTFYICSYPGATNDVYWIKSQGIFKGEFASELAFTAQLWAELRVDRSGNAVVLKRFGQMPVQSRTYNSTAGAVNDFWDWESF